VLKTEVRTLASQNADRSLMYPGLWQLTWLQVPWGWLLVDMQPAAASDVR
jgi:hypothetical protein